MSIILSENHNLLINIFFGLALEIISFNENLNKNFVKDLSLKLFEWTNLRWIIAFSKQNGKPTIKEVDKINKSQMFSSAEKSKIIKKVEEVFPDVELIDIELDKNN